MSTMIRSSRVVIVGLLALAGCSKSVACTAEARVSLVVHVVDTAGRPVCDATVIARDGSFSRRLASAPIGCTYSGITERKGTYDIEVRRGPRHASVDDVNVTADECHVHPRTVTVTLR